MMKKDYYRWEIWAEFKNIQSESIIFTLWSLQRLGKHEDKIRASHTNEGMKQTH